MHRNVFREASARSSSIGQRWLAIPTVCLVLVGILTAGSQSASPAAADPLPPTLVTLTTDKIEFFAGESFTLTATVDQPVDGAAPVVIRDVTDGVDVKECTTGTVCATTVAFTSGGPHEYVATVGSLTSSSVSVARSAWALTLEASETEIGAGEVTTLIATA
ncbi:hypothetical protein, partial [Microbacterium fluvii]|uniref:hypothetical protein n=1 Tax=Microbacterium fluvii TaxID=415215 RepID=UPI0031EE947A